MNNKEEFYSELGMLIKDHTDLDWDEVGVYIDILDQDDEIFNAIMNDFSVESVKYIKPEADDWNATKGSFIIGKYRLELCCYGEFAINIYKYSAFYDMLTIKHKTADLDEITSITDEIVILSEKINILANKLKQMA